MTSSGTFVENLKGWQLWTEFKAFRFVASFKQTLCKVFWVAVILGTLSGFVIQSVYILLGFFHYNVDTVVQLKSVEGLPFPAVTICNLNPIRKSAMDYVEALSDLQTVYNYLSQKRAHETGTDTFARTSRTKPSANDEMSLYREVDDDVPIIAESYVKRRPKRQAATAPATDSFTCGGELADAINVTQTFGSPVNAKGGYDSHLRCKWVIRGPTSANIAITLTDMGLEGCQDCQCDYLIISAADYPTLAALELSSRSVEPFLQPAAD